MTTANGMECLSREEETKLLRRAADGDKEAMEGIRGRYWPLVLRAAHQPHLATVREDAEGVAALSLMEAVVSYDASLGVPFAAYAKSRLFGDVRTWFRRERAKWQSEYVPFDTEEGESFWAQFPDPARETEETELKAAVEQELSKLPAEEREVIERLIDGRATQSDLARRDGVSFQCVTRRKQRALKKLQGLRKLLMEG